MVIMEAKIKTKKNCEDVISHFEKVIVFLQIGQQKKSKDLISFQKKGKYVSLQNL